MSRRSARCTRTKPRRSQEPVHERLTRGHLQDRAYRECWHSNCQRASNRTANVTYRLRPCKCCAHQLGKLVMSASSDEEAMDEQAKLPNLSPFDRRECATAHWFVSLSLEPARFASFGVAPALSVQISLPLSSSGLGSVT